MEQTYPHGKKQTGKDKSRRSRHIAMMGYAGKEESPSRKDIYSQD